MSGFRKWSGRVISIIISNLSCLYLWGLVYCPNLWNTEFPDNWHYTMSVEMWSYLIKLLPRQAVYPSSTEEFAQEQPGPDISSGTPDHETACQPLWGYPDFPREVKCTYRDRSFKMWQHILAKIFAKFLTKNSLSFSSIACYCFQEHFNHD